MLVEAGTVDFVVEAQRAARAQSLSGERVAQLDGLADHARGQLARAGGDDEFLAAAQLDQQHPRADQRATALGDQLEDHVEVGLAADGQRDLGGGVERGDGALELLAALAGACVAPRVVDRHSRELGEHGERLLVFGGELRAVGLLGEVKVAVGQPADHDRRAQEGAHRGVPAGEPVGAGVAPDVVEAQWHGILDQRSQHAASAGERSDRRVGGFVDPARDEPGELAARLVEHPECGVAGAGEFLCGVQHPLEHHVGVKLGEHVAS